MVIKIGVIEVITEVAEDMDADKTKKMPSHFEEAFLNSIAQYILK